jgi:probable phosphoglycerate mutase
MSATRLFLVRHGATVLSAEDRFAGSTDVELSDEGRSQAAHLAARMESEGLCAVYTSPMKRTRETAAIIAASHGLEVRVREGLREIDHGRWEQMTRAEVEERFADEYASWEADPFTFAPQGGESGISVMARALPVVREIVLEHAGERVLVVSHKATIRLVISGVLGLDARNYRDRLDQSPCCLNILDFKDPVRARLTLLNDVSHYAGTPTTPKARLSKWWDSGEAAPDGSRAR